MDIKMRALRWY